MSRDPGADELRMRRILQQRGVGPDGTPTRPAEDLVTAAAADRHAAAQPPAASDWWDALYAADAPQPDSGDAEADAQPEARSRRLRIPPWWTGRHVDITPPADDDTDDQDDDGDEDWEDLEDEGGDEQGEDAEDSDEHDGRSRKRSRPAARTRRSRSRAGKRSRSRDPHAPRALIDEPQGRSSLLDAYDRIPPRIRWLVLHSTAAAAGCALGWVGYSTRTAAWIAEHDALSASAIFWYAVAVGCEFLRHRYARHRLAIRWAAAVPIASIVTGTLLYGTGWTTLNLELPL